MNQNLTYKEATQELEAILKAIETDAVDVDELTQKVQRSAEAAINQVFEDIECNDEPETKQNTDQPSPGKLF